MVRVVHNGSLSIDGFERYSYNDICHIVLSYLSNCIDEYEMDCSIKAIAIYGSRNRHTANSESDLDIVVEYDGEEREDDCFNIFNNSPLLIDSIKVDINPISNYKTGSIDFFLEKSRLYDVELIKNLNNNL